MGVWGFSSRGKCGFGVLVRLLRDIGVIYGYGWKVI